MIYNTFDVETTGFYPYSGDTMFSYCIGDEDGNVGVYRLDGKNKKKNWKRLKEFFADTCVAKIAHNYKFELGFLKAASIHVPEKTIWHDTMIISQLLRNLAPSHALDKLCWELCYFSMDLDKKVHSMGKVLGGFQHVPKKLMKEYQITDGQRPMLLFKIFYKGLFENKKLYKDYLNEIELIKVTQRFEQFGIVISIKKSLELIEWMEKELEKNTSRCYKLLGEFVNLSGTEQVKKILYERYKFPILKYTDSEQPSIDKDVLMQLKEMYPKKKIFDMIFKTRSYTPGITKIQSYINFAGKERIIHPTINTNQARTGRQSSENPNVQNISKNAGLLTPFPIPARTIFKAHKGSVLFLVDYAGIEMRLIIEGSKDKRMLKILQAGKDPHVIATKYFYSQMKDIKSMDKTDPKQFAILRNAAKNGHFALAYGAGLGKIAKTLNLSVEELQPGYDKYCLKFPKIADFTLDMSSKVKEDGFITTPFGRKLYVDRNKPYVGANYMIQGMAAGILKKAQVLVDKYLREQWDDRIRILIPIHDELIINYDKKLLKYKKTILTKISKLMTTMPEINVPLEVEWKRSNSTWDKAEEVKI